MARFPELILTGWLLSTAFVLLIFLPWRRGRTDLISFWSFFLFGSLNFVAMGMITTPGGFSTALESHSAKYAVANLVFYGLFAVVYLWPIRAPLEPRPRWLRWPADTPNAMVVIAFSLACLSVLGSVAPAVQGSQLIFVLRSPMAIAGFATALILAIGSRTNLFYWGLAAFCFAVGGYSVLTWGTGRRELLALFLVVPAVAYWRHFRYSKVSRTLLALIVLGAVGGVVVTSYQSFRHEDREAGSTSERVVSRIEKFPSAVADTLTNWSWVGESGSAFDTQNGVYAGILALKYVDDGTLEPFYFHTPYFIATNPIPRAFWSNKPVGFGQILPRAAGQQRISWGPTIVGHAFYDGGWPVLVLYAFVLGGVIRFLDHQLAADPGNPWLVVTFCALAGHVIGFARGDCANFAVQILGVLVVLPLVLNVLRYFTGTRPPALVHRVPVAAAGTYTPSLQARPGLVR